MPERKNLCVPVAPHPGIRTLAEPLGDDGARPVSERRGSHSERTAGRQSASDARFLSHAPSPPVGVGSIAAGSGPTQRLRIRHQQDTLFVEALRPVLLLGRELGNDVNIMDPRASRQHARIERRREGFVLFDQSTNGTYVVIDGQAEHHLRQDRLVLKGSGRIGCGFSANEVERDLVFFELV